MICTRLVAIWFGLLELHAFLRFADGVECYDCLVQFNGTIDKQHCAEPSKAVTPTKKACKMCGTAFGYVIFGDEENKFGVRRYCETLDGFSEGCNGKYNVTRIFNDEKVRVYGRMCICAGNLCNDGTAPMDKAKEAVKEANRLFVLPDPADIVDAAKAAVGGKTATIKAAAAAAVQRSTCLIAISAVVGILSSFRK